MIADAASCPYIEILHRMQCIPLFHLHMMVVDTANIHFLSDALK